MAKEKTKSIKPLYDKIVVKRIESEGVSAGGILLPDSAKRKPTQGEVLAVGEGAVQLDGTIRKMRIKVGDIVMFGKYAGHEADLQDLGDDTLLILREDDVMGVVE